MGRAHRYRQQAHELAEAARNSRDTEAAIMLMVQARLYFDLARAVENPASDLPKAIEQFNAGQLRPDYPSSPGRG